MPDAGNETNLTPAPLDQTTITLAQGGAVSSAVSGSATQNPNLNFDPTAISQTLPNGQTTTYVKDASSAVSPMAPSLDNQTTISVNATPNTTLENALNPYIDVGYHITLGLVSNAAVAEMKASGDSHQDITPDQYIVFASTGDNQTGGNAASQSGSLGDNNDLNYTGDYYNIQYLSFRNIVGHYPQNPLIAVIVDGSMKIYEPYGFSFREDLNIMAEQVGYPEYQSPSYYVYRMEIWFHGYDPKTGAWNPQIPIPAPNPLNKNAVLKSIVYFLTITAVKAKVTPSGTFYDLSFQIFSHYQTRVENTYLHQDSANKGGIKITGNTETFGSFLKDLANLLHQQILDDTEQRLDVTYQFICPSFLFNAPFIEPARVDVTNSVDYATNSGSYASVADRIDLYTMINNVMLNVSVVRELLVQYNDSQFINPTIWWNVRHIESSSSPNQYSLQDNANRKYNFQYIIEPVVSYRSRVPAVTSQWNDQVQPQNQQARVNNAVNYGMLYRKYDYFFTGDNSEIIDFQFTFKNFFYMQIPYSGHEVTLHGQNHNTADLAVNVEQQLTQNAQGSQSSSIINIVPATTGLTLSDLGISAPPQSASGVNNAPNQHQSQGRTFSLPSVGDYGSYADAQLALTARDQYLRFDMINAQMTVRFDPQWLLNPYMTGRDRTPLLDSGTSATPGDPTDNITLYAHVDRMIYLNAYAPNQAGFMNPNTAVGNTRPTPILAGFYQVVQIDNVFEGAKFYQTMNMIKYDNTNYFSQNSGANSQIQQNATSSTNTPTFSTSGSAGPSGVDPSAATPLTPAG